MTTMTDFIPTFMTRWGITYSGPDRIPVSLFESDGSLQARPELLDQEHVETLRHALRAGFVLPPVIGMRVGQKVRLPDGRHRLDAHKKEGHRAIQAYILSPDTTHAQLNLITAAVNVGNGKPVPAFWRAKNACHLLNDGYSEAELAEALSLSISSIKAALKAQKTELRLAAAGVKGRNLSPSHLTELARLSNDAVFLATARMANETHYGFGDDFQKLITQLKTARSETAALAQVAQVRADRLAAVHLLKRGRRSPLANDRLRVTGTLGAVLALNPVHLKSFKTTDKEKKETDSRLNDAILHLTLLQEALNR